MRATIILLLGQLTVAGCAQKEPPTGIGNQPAKIGDYSRAEVEALRGSISKLTFPVPEHTLEKMLPRHIEPLPIEFADAFYSRTDGISGGNVVEYWLNDRYVLKVATVYHSEGEKHFSLEEWAVILTRDERDSYKRPIYK